MAGKSRFVPVIDLVRMKLNSYRDKDRVHVRGMDAVGLITPEVERALPVELGSNTVNGLRYQARASAPLRGSAPAATMPLPASDTMAALLPME